MFPETSVISIKETNIKKKLREKKKKKKKRPCDRHPHAGTWTVSPREALEGRVRLR